MIKKDLKKKQQKKKYKFLSRNFGSAVFLSAVCLGAASYFLLFTPLINDYKEYNQKSLAAKIEEYRVKKEILNELTEAEGIYNKITPDLKDRLAEILPHQTDLPELYNNFEQLATSAGFKLLSLDIELLKAEKNNSTDTDKQETKIKEIGINLNIAGGGYNNLKDFLDLAEHNLRIFDIQSFVYSPDETAFDISLKAYFYEE